MEYLEQFALLKHHDPDHFLTWLYIHGYRIMPVPARRPTYTGPSLIGKSHASIIVGTTR